MRFNIAKQGVFIINKYCIFQNPCIIRYFNDCFKLATHFQAKKGPCIYFNKVQKYIEL